MGAIDAIAIALKTLGLQDVPNRLHERARASLVEHALRLAGFVIVPVKTAVAEQCSTLLRENESLRDALHITHGALLIIGTPYATEIADAVAPFLSSPTEGGK